MIHPYLRQVTNLFSQFSIAFCYPKKFQKFEIDLLLTTNYSLCSIIHPMMSSLIYFPQAITQQTHVILHRVSPEPPVPTLLQFLLPLMTLKVPFSNLKAFIQFIQFV